MSQLSLNTNSTAKKPFIARYAKALFDYEARDSDELTFEEDDTIIKVTAAQTDGWLYGELNGASGYFPDSYVEMMSESMDDLIEPDELESMATNSDKSWFSIFKKKPHDRKATEESIASNSTIDTITTLEQSKVKVAKNNSTDLKTQAVISSNKITVSVISQHAAVKQRWIDIMGGSEKVSKMPKFDKKEIQRQEVMYEILTTEKDYIDDLEIMINVFM